LARRSYGAARMIEPSADLGWVIFERLRRLAGLGFVAFAADRWQAALRNLREGKLSCAKLTAAVRFLLL
jgi:hypothetical protein